MPYTPMMLQYLETKEKYNDCILFFRLGDFYEMFFEDAKTASRELEITLTGKDCGMEERAPMCGVPYHSADSYIAKLVSRGYKVAICEQVEDPTTAKGIVKRDVVRIITPGTVTDGSMLVDNRNNYLCATYFDGDSAGIAVSDISTAEIYATDFAEGDTMHKIINELGLFSPSEIIINLPADSCKEIVDFASVRLGAHLEAGEAQRFIMNKARLAKQFGDEYTSRFGIPEGSCALNALCALLSYIDETQKSDISYINKLNYYTNEQFMQIDANTRRNLELCETMRSKEKKGSLLGVLDKTKTAMGARLLRKWLEQPLLSCNLIEKRQQAVSGLFDDMITKDSICERLSNVSDIERLMTRIVCNTANGRDLKALELTINQIPTIKKLLSGFGSSELSQLNSDMDPLEDIGKTIYEAIDDITGLLSRDFGQEDGKFDPWA